METGDKRELTETDKTEIFRIATRDLERHFGDAMRKGMSDAELENALAMTLGIFGGSGGPGQYSISFSGSGLRIWGGWRTVNHVKDKPLFSGTRTIAKARKVYGIADPADAQLKLF